MSGSNALRYLRLKLKTGFLKVEPPEYRYLIKYPPLSRDSAPPLYNIKKHGIPYLDLYQKIVQNNPVMGDEAVYPAYWQEEPIAMTMAKKQYQLMKEGMDEENAYDEAMKYVNEIESLAYEKLCNLRTLIKDNNKIRDSFLSNPAITKKINHFTKLLSDKTYYELDSADQGELDYFIQNDILKWGEVERCRRMIDPVFVWQFEKLREQLFPSIISDRNKETINTRDEYKSLYLLLHDLKLSDIKTNSPFYYEDFSVAFYQLRDKPYLVRWTDRNREILFNWIKDTLVTRNTLDLANDVEFGVEDLQAEIDYIRSQFFPMIKYPEMASSLQIPDVNTLRKILYDNDIGYKVDNNKLYIKRFYKLPALLFPKETWLTSLLDDEFKLNELINDNEKLINEIKLSGFKDDDIADLETKLNKYYNQMKFGLQLQELSSDFSNSGLSSLDELLMDKEDENPFLSEYDSADGDDDSPTEKNYNENLSIDLDKSEEISEDDIDESDDDDITDDEFMAITEKLFPKPLTLLEKDRMTYFTSLTDSENLYNPNNDYDLMDLQELKAAKLNTDVIQSARFKVDFEIKDSARIQREWKKQGLLNEEFPEPDIKLLD